MSEQKVTLYHCTLTKSVPNIRKKGILPMQRSNWVVSGTGERYGGGSIFAFDDYKDAVTWAMKWDWNISDDFGTGEISIVEFLADPKNWSEDNSDPLTRYSYRGKWLKSDRRVLPEDIQGTEVCTQSVIDAALDRKPRNENPRPRNKVFRVNPGYGNRDIEITVAVVDGYRVGYLSKDSLGNVFPLSTTPNKRMGTYRFYALNSDGTPDTSLYADNGHEGEDYSAKWTINGSEDFNDSEFSRHTTRKSALRALVAIKASGRTDNPKGGVRIPAYLRTPKLKPYIEQGLITQEIVDLYEQAHKLAKEYIEIERHQDRDNPPLTPEKQILLNQVCGVGRKIYSLLSRPPYYAEDFPFMRAAYNHGDDSFVGLDMIQKYRGIMRKSLRDDRTDNPRPRNKVFTVLPYTTYPEYYLENPERAELAKVEVTVATLDGVKVAYTTKSDARSRSLSGHRENTTPSEAGVLYRVNSDGTPDLSVAVVTGERRGEWRIEDYRHNYDTDYYPSRREALQRLYDYDDIPDRRANPDDPNDTSWIPKRRAPLARSYETELESYDTEIKPLEDTELRARAKKFLAGGNDLKQSLIASLQSPLAKYAPPAPITRFRVEVPDNRVFVYGYDPHLRFGEGAFFCDLYQLLSDDESAKKLVGIAWELKDIGNNDVLSVIEDYDLSQYIPFEHLANLQRGKPFDRADNPSSRRANPEVSVELSPSARFEITKAFLEHEYTDVIERGYAIGYLRHLLYDTQKPETAEISQNRRMEIAKTVKAESENDD
jgi:hypothetical protein